MRPYPLMPERSQIGNIYTPYDVLHGLRGLGAAPYDLRMYHNEGVGRLGATDSAANPNPTDVKMVGAGVAGGVVLGVAIGYLFFKR